MAELLKNPFRKLNLTRRPFSRTWLGRLCFAEERHVLRVQELDSNRTAEPHTRRFRLYSGHRFLLQATATSPA